jgi:hypothetical protein
MYVISSWLALASTAQAYRPFNGTDADVTDEGEFELELGPLQFTRADSRNYLQLPATVLNLGIFPRAELVADLVGIVPLRPLPNEAHYSGQDTDLLLKVVCLRGALQGEGNGPSLAVEGGPLLPELANDHHFGLTANLIVSERFGWFLAHLNSGAKLSRGTLRLAATESLISEFRVNDTIWPVTELLWSREFITGQSIYSALAGAIWREAEELSFDAALRVASVDRAFAFEARLGFTWTLEVWN